MISNFRDEHPGGKKILEAYHSGRDATEAFNGGVYNHTNATRAQMTITGVTRILQETEDL
eukprot:TRINITY_DN15043_c0_g1_i1.p3 TRINITY_DN15043_c0_g1~~TRINITY_DN15043_c0_g1_i1.p3  ORF type:complete len:60 (-),score=10.66 TRINITY_DN15043_c0_g1_i1:35-214(-)